LIRQHIDSLTVWAVGRDLAEPNTSQQQEGFGGVMVYRQMNPYSDPRKKDYIPGWDFFVSALSRFGGANIEVSKSDSGNSGSGEKFTILIPVAVSTIAAAIGDHMDRFLLSTVSPFRGILPIVPLEKLIWPKFSSNRITADRLPLQLHLELYAFNSIYLEGPTSSIDTDSYSWSQLHTQLIPAQFMPRYRRSLSRKTVSKARSSTDLISEPRVPSMITLEGTLAGDSVMLPRDSYETGLGISMWVTDAKGFTLFEVPFCHKAKLIPAANPGGNAVAFCETHIYDVHVPTKTLSGGHHNVLTLHVRPPTAANEKAEIRMIRVSLDPAEVCSVMRDDCWLTCCDPGV